MIELRGKYGTAIVFTDNIDASAANQIIELCDQEFVAGSKIRIMPDCHSGAGCVIGFTANLGDKVIPNIVGVDIGCGVLTIKLGKIKTPDLSSLDEIIHKHVPSGRDTHRGRVVRFDKLRDLHCCRNLKDPKRIERSIGTLGGGNHFIELNVDSEGNHYLVIHSGSRSLGKQVADYYQNFAVDLCRGKEELVVQREELIEAYKAQGKRKLIRKALKELEKHYNGRHPKYPKDLCFLSGAHREKYLHDMDICQAYATVNRNTMGETVLQNWLGRGLCSFARFHTVHNYIDFKDNIIRKGAISAYAGEEVLIPVNMRDGSLLCVGKGNPDWNYSAPHGAGRLMSRSKAKEKVTLLEFTDSMKGIYTSTVSESTIDEAPMAYKPIEEILSNIGDTAEVVAVIKPVYNFKAAE